MSEAMNLRSIKARYGLTPDTEIIVCAACKQASCWTTDFMCDASRNANTEKRTVRELHELKLEHPSYWRKEIDSRGGK